MGCCATSDWEHANLELGTDLAIQDQKLTCDSEGFADVSLSSNRDSDSLKTDCSKGKNRVEPLLIDSSATVDPTLITPRFGGLSPRPMNLRNTTVSH